MSITESIRFRLARAAEAVHGRVVSLADYRRTSGISRAARSLVRNLPPRPLPMYWYTGVPNFGDQLSPAIVAHVSGADPVRVGPRCGRKLLALGSLVHFARPGDVVWGTGALQRRRVNGREVRFLAVRGPLTRDLVDGDVPEVYGDPAYLLPQFYRPAPVGRRYDVGIVAHYKDHDLLFTGDPAVAEIDVTCGDWKAVVNRIVSCDVIVSSSLHGIIVAEAYGIPAVWIMPSNRLRGGDFKFRDYYAATRREVEPAPWSRGAASLVRAAKPPVPLDPDPILRAWQAVA